MRVYIVAALVVMFCGSCSHGHETAPSGDDARSQPSAATAPSSLQPSSPQSARDDRKVIAVFGDSLAAGFGLPAGKSFPDYLQRRLDADGYSWHVVNLGISGDTTEGGTARIESATSLKPSIVILELGGNDGLRGLPLVNTRENLDRMIGAFQSAGAKVVLAGMTLPPNYGFDYVRDFQKIYADLAVKHHTPLISFLLADIVTKDLRYFQADGIHPTSQGAEIVASTVLKALHPLLGKPEPNDTPVDKPVRPGSPR